MKLFRLGCIFLAGLSSPALAVCGTNACSDVTITRLWTAADGKAYVKISDDISPLNCSPLNSEYLTLLQSDSSSAWVYSAMLTSFTALGGKLARIRINEGTGGCTISYVWQEP